MRLTSGTTFLPQYEKEMCEQGDGPNHHAFGTFVMPPADSASRAGVMPKASGDRSSRTFARNIIYDPHPTCTFTAWIA